MASSEVQLCNQALQKLGEQRITSLTQDHPNARDCNVAYAAMRDLELRRHPWSFAITRAELAADATDPDFGFDNRYLLPTDCLRLLDPDPLGNTNDRDWTIEGRYVLTDWDAPLQIRYVKRVTDTTQFDALFDEALACRIALQLCEMKTQSNPKLENIKQQYKDAISEARRINAIEKISAEMPEDTWITVRV